MRNFLRNKLLLSIIFSFCFTSFAAAENLCANKKAYNIGFFNGVGNSRRDAKLNRDSLRPLVSTLDSYNMPVKYTLFYNRTKGYILDVTEVFAQKYEELGLSLNGKPESYFELFWYILNYTDVNVKDLVDMAGDPYIKTLYELIIKIPEYADLKDYLEKALASLTSAALTAMVTKEYNETTIADYKIHDDSLKNLLAEDYNVVLVAHSQGNLFVTHAYEDIVGSKGAYPQLHGRVNVVHVAPVNVASNLKGKAF